MEEEGAETAPRKRKVGNQVPHPRRGKGEAEVEATEEGKEGKEILQRRREGKGPLQRRSEVAYAFRYIFGTQCTNASLSHASWARRRISADELALDLNSAIGGDGARRHTSAHWEVCLVELPVGGRRPVPLRHARELFVPSYCRVSLSQQPA